MRPTCFLLLAVVLAAQSGCQEASAPKAYRVMGRVIVGSFPAAKACVAFHPMDKVKSQGRCPVAFTGADGSFELTTYALHDGAPAGDYTVTILWLDESTMPTDECECTDPLQHDRLAGACADPETTPLMATVLPKENELILWTPGVRKYPFAGATTRPAAAAAR
ncbi:hypothetical protein [Planctomicrobium piriforme]|uniref:Carboxypeptidase regulatory-like domain-containing protein n=1 Tax=Planctomicrobium piriforme TaxID=1576369 RepID=A0A1I3B0K5_9PLAN|nr:hypothetical protein [Planctomicrobium piriforme]SFH55626.1 hypothetical protein SAMN05421753_101148 [Planctomicrobium piriforme]